MRSIGARRIVVLAAALSCLPAVRQAGAEGFAGIEVLPEAPTIHDPLRITVAEFSEFDPEFELATIEGGRIVITGTYGEFGGVPLGASLWSETFTVGPLPAGSYTVEFRFAVSSQVTEVYSQSVNVVPPAPVLDLHGGRFQARVDWQNPFAPGSGEGFARALTDQSGVFWFFDPANVEVTVKVLDGRAVNGHFWVFIANMSTVEFTVTLEDCPLDGLSFPCAARTYHNPPFENRNFLDTRAFPASLALAPGLASRDSVLQAEMPPFERIFEGIRIAPRDPTTLDRLEITVASLHGDAHFSVKSVEADRIVIFGGSDQILGVPPLDGPIKTFSLGPLAAGTYTVEFTLSVAGHYRQYTRTVTIAPPDPVLALRGGRFRVRVDWVNPYAPGRGQGFADAFSDESGAFWFFAPSNVEVTVKILDGRAVNGRFWVFIANQSTVEFTATVEDCPPDGLPLPCTTRKYHNPAFANRNFIDTRAFQ